MSKLLKLLSLDAVLWVAAISGLVVLLDTFVLRKQRNNEAAGEPVPPPMFVSVARTVLAWSSVIALLWYMIILQGLELALVAATVLTGVVYALDVFVLRKQRIEAYGEKAAEPPAVEYARSFFPVILIVLLVRSFLFEPFRIPSTSMVPTLLVGDFIFVNKFSYGIRLPVLRNEVVSFGKPKRGDVVVFRLPADGRTNFIKRVVGLPGDRVSYHGDELRINGEVVPVETVGAYEGTGGERNSVLLHESLGERVHDVLHVPGVRGLQGDWTVPPGKYFMMGDNRDNSKDSRSRDVGLVPEANLVGRAEIVWLSISLPPNLGLRLGRFGDSIT